MNELNDNAAVRATANDDNEYEVRPFTSMFNQSYTEDDGTEREINVTFASPKYPSMGRILPAFDARVNIRDDAFLSSWEGYRFKNGAKNEVTGNEQYTGWFFEFFGYGMYGHGRYNFPVPGTTKFLDGGHVDGSDPIVDLRKFVYKRAKEGDSSLKWLVEASVEPAYKNDPGITWTPRNLTPLPNPTPILICNIFGAGYKQEDSEWKNRLLLLKGYTAIKAFVGASKPPKKGTVELSELRGMLDWPSTRNQQAYDPEWESYLLGDITHPTNGLVYTIAAGSMSNKNAQYALMKFTDDNTKLVNHKTYPVDESVLKQRYRLRDHRLFQIPTYQDIVNILVEDGMVPRDIIAMACSAKANIPEAKPKTEYYSGATQTQAAPATPPPGSVTSTTMGLPPVTPDGVIYYIHENNQNVQITNVDLQQKVDQGFDGYVYTNGAWVKPGDIGFTKRVAPAAPVSAPPSSPPPGAPAGPPPQNDYIPGLQGDPALENKTTAAPAAMNAQPVPMAQPAPVAQPAPMSAAPPAATNMAQPVAMSAQPAPVTDIPQAASGQGMPSANANIPMPPPGQAANSASVLNTPPPAGLGTAPAATPATPSPMASSPPAVPAAQEQRTAEEEERWQALDDKVAKDDELTPAELTEYSSLMQKAPYQG